MKTIVETKHTNQLPNYPKTTIKEYPGKLTKEQVFAIEYPYLASQGYPSDTSRVDRMVLSYAV